jgi:hypothetical protein
MKFSNKLDDHELCSGSKVSQRMAVGNVPGGRGGDEQRRWWRIVGRGMLLIGYGATVTPCPYP